MIEAQSLTKRYGDKVAVDDLSFSVEPGQITGFLGPNGAGKTTTMRLHPRAGPPDRGDRDRARQGRSRAAGPADAGGGRAAGRQGGARRPAARYNHLRCLAADQQPARAAGSTRCSTWSASPTVARKRSEGLLARHGPAARHRRARCSATRPILMLDEPVNGLDPEGILWIRNLMKALAAEGRTVFVSSHLMSEMENTADHLLVIGRGRLIADCTVAEFIDATTRCRRSGSRTPQPSLRSRRTLAGGPCADARGRRVRWSRAWTRQLGDLAFEQRHPAARAGPGARLAGGGVHGADRVQRGVPRQYRHPPGASDRGRGGLTMASTMELPGCRRRGPLTRRRAGSPARSARSSPRSARSARPGGRCVDPGRGRDRGQEPLA